MFKALPWAAISRGLQRPSAEERGALFLSAHVVCAPHILPQSFADNWPVEGLEAEEARAEHVHRLGNLTLLTTSLNSKVSNGPWPSKRQALQQHDTLLLNSRLLSTYGDGWDEQGIESRGDSMIDSLLEVWPVPDGHEGVVVDPHEKTGGRIEVKHLVAAGLLPPGTVLTPRSGEWESRVAVVRADGLLEIDGKTFESPSGAGRYVKGGITNGWSFWRLPDGRKLLHVRAVYSGDDPTKTSTTFDWSALHTILEALPGGTGRPTAVSRMSSARRPCRWGSTSRPAGSARTPIAF